MGVLQGLHLWFFWWCKEKDTFFIKCPTHGLKVAKPISRDRIICVDCLEEMLKA